jgi:NhaP-type Na+/H+ or K+/H+ antiporter
MNTFIKFLFTIVGGGLVGFGLGILAHKNNLLSGQQFEVAIILSLISGGFFLALGIPGRKVQQEPEQPSQSVSQSPQN